MKIKKEFKKIISLLLIIGLNWTGILAISGTRSYFNDIEISEENIMSAGTLDMAIRSGQGNFISPAENMNPGDSTARDIYVGKTALSLPLKHQVSFEFINGDLDLCDQLDLKIWYDHYFGLPSGGYANRDMRLTYNGKLSELDKYTNTDFIIPHPDDWFDLDPSDGTEQWFYYSINLPNDVGDSYQGKTCNFNFVYEGWQDNMNYGEGGFTDVERISNIISTESQTVDLCMKINEVYYDPDDAHQGEPNEEKFEWIELYNACDETINLQNWYIEDNNDKEIIHSSYPINPGKFVVVAASAAVWNKYWALIPVHAVKIALGGLMMSDGLDNSGDRVILYDNNNNQIDEVSWGTDFIGLNPPVPDVVEGHSISRKVKGIDTDSNLDWMDTNSGSTPPGPNPGTNPHTADGKLLLPSTTDSILEPIPEPINNNEEKSEDEGEITEDKEMKNEKNEIEIKIDDDNSDDEDVDLETDDDDEIKNEDVGADMKEENDEEEEDI